MTLPIEQEKGITFADAGIDLSRARGSGPEVQAPCPRCHGRRSTTEKNKRRELSVNLETGGWLCQHCGYAGGLGKAMVERRWQGFGANGGGAMTRGNVTAAAPVREEPKTTTATAIDETELPDGMEQAGLDWLRDRGIGPEIAAAFDVRSRGDMLYLPFRVKGELVNVKRRSLSKKAFTQVAGASKSLFNVDAATGADVLVFVEGELDAMACAAAGWIAVTTPDGAPGRHEDAQTGEIIVGAVGRKLDALNEETSARALAGASRIVIATDGDPEGMALRDALIERLNPARCWVVTWPEGCKDANDVLMRHGAERLDSVLGDARPVDLPGVADFMRERDALDRIWTHGFDTGVSTGWDAFDHYFRPRLGTLNLVTGVPGSGKTTFMLDLLSRLAHLHDWKGAIFSPESGDTGTLFAKLVQIAADAPVLPCDNQMSRETLWAAAEWVNQHFWRIDAARDDQDSGYGVVTLPEIVQRIESCVLRRGITMVYIDPWNRMESSRPNGMTETEYVAWAVNMLHRLAQRHNLFLMLVAHPHKVENEDVMISPYQISGSAHWYNMADVIIGVQRNKRADPKDRTTVAILKHREEGISGHLGETYFHFDGRRSRFYTDIHQMPMDTGTAPFMALPFDPAASGGGNAPRTQI